jgi:hypothetical protein
MIRQPKETAMTIRSTFTCLAAVLAAGMILFAAIDGAYARGSGVGSGGGGYVAGFTAAGGIRAPIGPAKPPPNYSNPLKPPPGSIKLPSCRPPVLVPCG